MNMSYTGKERLAKDTHYLYYLLYLQTYSVSKKLYYFFKLFK